MTASHCFFNGKTIDISENYENKSKAKDGISYEEDLKDPGF